MQERDIVDTFTQFGKQVADPFAALAVLFELPSWFYDATFVTVSATTKGFHRDRFVIHADHIRLVVEGIDLAWTAVHKKEDHRLGFWLVMRRVLGYALRLTSRCPIPEESVRSQKRSESDAAKTAA